jgi:hypothetical protein
MTPLPEKPVVVIQIDKYGAVVSVATNVSENLKIEVAADKPTFKYKSKGMPFVLKEESTW